MNSKKLKKMTSNNINTKVQKIKIKKEIKK